MASEGSPREQLEHAARVIAGNNRLSHDWEDFVEAAQALERAGLLPDPLAHMASDGAEPVHFVAYEEAPRPTPREVAAESFPWKHVAGAFSNSPIARLLRDHGDYQATAGTGMPEERLRQLRDFYLKLRAEQVVVEFRPALGGYTYQARRDTDGDLIIRVNELAQMTPEAEVIWRFPRNLPLEEEHRRDD